MKGPAILLLHSLKRARNIVLALGILLSLFQLFLILMARAYEVEGSFAQMAALMPPFMRDLIGSSMASFLSFGGMVSLGYFHPVVMAALIGLEISIATGPTAEIESGFMDLILSRPLARHWVITRTIFASAICAVVVLSMMLITTALGLRMLAPPGSELPSFQLLFSLAANLGLLMLCWSGITLMIATTSQRRGVAGWIAGLFAVATFLLDYIGRAWPAAAKLWVLSPFHYYSPLDLIMGRPLVFSNLIVLAAIAAVTSGLSYIFFLRRDITH